MAQELRQYQSDALNQLRRGIKEKLGPQVLMLPTGAGKTTVASAMKQGVQARGKRAFFVVDSLELVQQAVDRFVADGLNVGVIQGNHELTNYNHPIQVATIQTLRSRWQYLADHFKPDLLVIDECHVLHKAHIEIMGECNKRGVPVIGLSATPFRKGLGLHFKRLVVGTTLAELTELGYLVKAHCYAPHVPDMKGVKSSSDGDWADDALAEVMGDAKIMGNVVKHWFELAENRQTVVFGCNVAHSRELCRQFVQAGVDAAHVDGYMDEDERKAIIDGFRGGRIKVLCNVAVLTKGFDAPETACVVLARPTKSLMMHYQMMGRGLRPAPGKSDCIIIDHAGNCLRSGIPTESLPTELDDGKNKLKDRREREAKAEKLPRPCGKCSMMFTGHKCPACGFAPKPHEDVEWKDGQLVPLGQSKRKTFSTEQKQDIYAQFLGFARTHGYKEGWAWFKCQEYCGSAPRDKHAVAAKAPSAELLGWIRHSQIKRAKQGSAA